MAKSRYSVQTHIEARLNLARFLYYAGFKLTTRKLALRFVTKLMRSEFLQMATLDELPIEKRHEFHKLLDQCLNLIRK